MTDIIAFSPRNVWTFGGGWKAHPGLGTWHLRTRTWTWTWTRLSGLGANITTVSAVSASNIWAIGGLKAGADAVLHYANGSWHQVTGTTLAGLRFDGILADSANSLWVTATTTAHPASSLLLHLSGGQWTPYAAPDTFSTLGYYRGGQIAPDSHGGLWITDGSQLNPGRMLYFSASGQWAMSAVANGAISHTVRAPGGTTLWAAGETAWDGQFKAGTIWRLR